MHAGYHTPSGTETPWKQTPPQKQTPLEADTPCAVHAGRYGQQAGGMHPTGVQCCITIKNVITPL